MRYHVTVPRPVRKRIEALPSHIRSRVLADVSGLGDDPRPRGCLKLQGVEGNIVSASETIGYGIRCMTTARQSC
jgi:mRNA-degrading endonuclease RelE of RelBE toxin-antitoxin system